LVGPDVNQGLKLLKVVAWVEAKAPEICNREMAIGCRTLGRVRGEALGLWSLGGVRGNRRALGLWSLPNMREVRGNGADVVERIGTVYRLSLVDAPCTAAAHSSLASRTSTAPRHLSKANYWSLFIFSSHISAHIPS
jgi:hypothetical protein